MEAKESEPWEITDVVICGGGPTGSLLSAYLGQLRVKNVVLEKERDIPPDPRAFSLGEDGIRHLQAIGLYEHVYTDIARPLTRGLFLGGREPDLHKTPFLTLHWESVVSHTGHVARVMFKQPVMEKHVRNVIARTPAAEYRIQSTVTSIDQDDEWVYVRYQSAYGDERRIRGKFLVGADGKTGFTRKMYLEAKGIRMEKTHKQQLDFRYNETWIAITWDITMPTPETHPDFPLWIHGYTPIEVFHAFFPQSFIFISNPERPACAALMGQSTDSTHLWRTEYCVNEGEDVADMAKVETVKRIILPYYTHPGSRYGLKYKVQFPEDCMKIRIVTPYTFAAKTCNRWFHGRVLLCGDSSHVFPPFGGQGIGAGFDDAAGLAWRLAMACRPDPLSFEHLLVSWNMERRQAIQNALAVTVHLGDLCTERNAIKSLIRDWMLWAMRLVPSWKRQMESPDVSIKPYVYERGMTFLPELGGGSYFPQIYCVPLDSGSDQASIMLTDDVIFASRKQGLLQLVVLVDTLAEACSEQDALSNIDELSNGEVLASDVTYIVHDYNAPLAPAGRSSGSPANIVRVATTEEFSRSTLCKGRPAPQTYDEHQILKDMNWKRLIVVRPDRFVFAACADKRELEQALGSIGRVLLDSIA